MDFITIFTRLCNESGKSPTLVCAELGFSNAIYTYWRKNRATPRTAALHRIADYFGVTAEYLTGDTPERDARKPRVKKGEAEEAVSDIDFALTGEIMQLTENEKRDILDYIRFKKQQREGGK